MSVLDDAPTQIGPDFSTISVLKDTAPALTILWHPDPSRVGAMLSLADLRPGRSISISRRSPEFPHLTAFAAPLADTFLSRSPFLEIARVAGSLRLTPLTTQLAIALDGQPLTGPVVIDPTKVAAGAVITLGKRIALCLHYATPAIGDDFGLLGHSYAMNGVRSAIRSVADLTVPVLIRGETGTGKELTAAAIVRAGPRADKPFITVNIGALPQQLATAEILGHEKGAFTGALASRHGYFAEADNGTLFLDEIGLANSEVQTALLRVLETNEVRPLGGRTARRVNVRVLAATDSQIDDALTEDGFSQPLFHRLSSMQIRIPPLRERREDIGLLLLHFLKDVMTQTGDLLKLQTPEGTKRPWLSATAVATLAMAPWPGNVRQLRNCATTLVVANRGAPAAHLPHDLLASLAPTTALPATGLSPERVGTERGQPITHEKLVDALARHDFQPARAAKALGISRTTIYHHIQRDPTLGQVARISESQLAKELKACDGDLHAVARRLKVSPRSLRIWMNKA
jgi:two-component system nitrogen regulation response regulator GlnG